MASVCVILGAPWDVVMGMTLAQLYAIAKADLNRQSRTLRHNLIAAQGGQSAEGFQVAVKEIERLTTK